MGFRWTGRFVIASALVLCAVALASGARARAAFGGVPGRLVFQSGYGDIYSVRADGSGLHRLTRDGHSLTPRWSPDGRRIVFARSGDIYVMGARGRNVRRLTHLGDAYSPTWRAGGKGIVFVRSVFPSYPLGTLWKVPARGGQPQLLINDMAHSCGDTEAVISPTGNRIAYTQRLGRILPSGYCSLNGSRVVVVNLRSHVRHTIPDASRPSFTSDGRGLVFVQSGILLDWSNLRGGAVTYLRLHFACQDADICLGDVTTGPTSSYPASPDIVYAWSPVTDQGIGCSCITTTIAGTSHTFALPPGRSVYTLDWQALPNPSP